jgi:hypothetical protein
VGDAARLGEEARARGDRPPVAAIAPYPPDLSYGARHSKFAGLFGSPPPR